MKIRDLKGAATKGTQVEGEETGEGNCAYSCFGYTRLYMSVMTKDVLCYVAVYLLLALIHLFFFHSDDLKPQPKKRLKVCIDFLTTIDQTGIYGFVIDQTGVKLNLHFVQCTLFFECPVKLFTCKESPICF